MPLLSYLSFPTARGIHPSSDSIDIRVWVREVCWVVAFMTISVVRCLKTVVRGWWPHVTYVVAGSNRISVQLLLHGWGFRYGELLHIFLCNPLRLNKKMMVLKSISLAMTFWMVMILNPSVQKKAQAELDAVIGTRKDRLPTNKDKADLPYIRSIMAEVSRWGTPVPFCLSYALSKFVYQN